MITDDAGIAIRNPLRDCTVPWGAVRAVDVGEAVQVHYSLPDGTEKVFPSWAMFSTSRAQLKADMRARKRAAHLSKTSPMYDQLPDQAKDTMARTEAQLVAWQLDERAERARTAGAAAGQPTLGWAWSSMAAIAAPAIALVVLLLT
jgi:Bacterial PH domain